jgi:general secretion pathway protein H
MRQRGFTLIEIVVVVGLIALLTAVIAATVTGGLGSAKVRAASKDLVAALRFTRSQAVVKRESQVLMLDVGRHAYRAPGRDWVELPEAMQLSMLTAAQEQVDDEIGQIRFYADGSSTGGNIELRRGEALWRIDVAWLTGEVRLSADSQR